MSVEEIISNLENDNMIDAKAAFQAALNDKISVAMDQERINVANSIYNGVEETEEEIEIEDPSEEEIEQEIETPVEVETEEPVAEEE